MLFPTTFFIGTYRWGGDTDDTYPCAIFRDAACEGEPLWHPAIITESEEEDLERVVELLESLGHSVVDMRERDEPPEEECPWQELRTLSLDPVSQHLLSELVTAVRAHPRLRAAQESDEIRLQSFSIYSPRTRWVAVWSTKHWAPRKVWAFGESYNSDQLCLDIWTVKPDLGPPHERPSSFDWDTRRYFEHDEDYLLVGAVVRALLAQLPEVP